MIRKGGDPETGSNVDFEALVLQKNSISYPIPDFLGFAKGLVGTVVRQDNHELIACISYGIGRAFCYFLNRLPHLLDREASIEMTICVHDILEVVEIHEDHGNNQPL